MMNLKRKALLSVAALMVCSVAVVACTRPHEDTAPAEAAVVDEACGDDDEAPGATTDDVSTASHREGRKGRAKAGAAAKDRRGLPKAGVAAKDRRGRARAGAAEGRKGRVKPGA